MKHIQPDIYKDWYCPRCNKFEENFNHVWLCEANGMTVFNIMSTFRQQLLDNLIYFDNSISSEFLSHDTLWNIGEHPENFTFIDIIKGIVPSFFTDKIFSVTNNSKFTFDLIQILYDALYIDIKEFIWKPRCDTMLTLERSLNIDKKTKKRRTRNRTFTSSSSNSLTNYLGYNNYGLDLEVKIGGKWQDFTELLNHCSWLGEFLIFSFSFSF